VFFGGHSGQTLPSCGLDQRRGVGAVGAIDASDRGAANRELVGVGLAAVRSPAAAIIVSSLTRGWDRERQQGDKHQDLFHRLFPSFGGTTIQALVFFIGAELDGPLEDRTGLTGQFDLMLEFQSAVMERLGGLPAAGDTPTAPALRDAVRDQLGLKIEKTIGPVTFTVIDSIERPTPD